MLKTRLNQFLASFLTFLLLLLGFQLLSPQYVLSAADHLVISEIQVAGTTTTDDFIEIYNPTDTEVSLDGYRLVKRTSTGSSNDSIEAFDSDQTIAAHGFYLWCNSGLAETETCDASSSAIVSNNNSVALINGAINDPVLDAVTFGTPDNPLGEGASLTAPEANASVERKAQSTSTAESMGPSGTDELLGNGEDTQDNASDFVTRTASQPQNKASAIETLPTPTPEPTPTQTPEPTPTATPEPSPSEEPTPTPTATPEPTVTPEPSPSDEPLPTPTATPEPTATPQPSATPTPTPEPSPSEEPEVSPTPEPSPSEEPEVSPTPEPSVTPQPSVSPSPTAEPQERVIFSGLLFRCTMSYRTIWGSFFKIKIPHIDCERI